jgi:hypothetical protein
LGRIEARDRRFRRRQEQKQRLADMLQAESRALERKKELELENFNKKKEQLIEELTRLRSQGKEQSSGQNASRISNKSQPWPPHRASRT